MRHKLDADEQRVEKEKIEGREPSRVKMLGVVPMPLDADRCSATSKRSGKRCKRYRQAGSSACSKHASSVTQATQSRLRVGESGLGKTNRPPAADTWPWDEEEWLRRFDTVNDWVSDELSKANPELSKALWDFFSLVEAELLPGQIFDLAAWFRDVLQGAAVIAEDEGLTLTGVTPPALTRV